jgi:hypothetical protein
MRIGVLWPTTWTLIEKYGALFSEGIEVVGPQNGNLDDWNKVYSLKKKEWEELGLRIKLTLKPYKDIRFSDYDVMFESTETFTWAKDWKDYCNKIGCPVIQKACWIKKPKEVLPRNYIRTRKDYPVLLEMPAHASGWTKVGFTDVNVVFNPVGNWWFDQTWTGKSNRILFVLAGTNVWRDKDPTRCGLDIWAKIAKDFPNEAYHHDGHDVYTSPLQMVKLFSESLVLVNLDRPYGQGERPMTIVFTEALSAGMPVMARNLPGLNFRDYIDMNGECTNDYEKMKSFLHRCLNDHDFAKSCSRRSREIGESQFSVKMLRPKYDAIIQRAVEVYDKGS